MWSNLYFRQLEVSCYWFFIQLRKSYCCENEKSKRAARYKAQSFVKPVYGNMLRLIVIKGNDPENKVIKNIEKIRKTIEVDIKKVIQ